MELNFSEKEKQGFVLASVLFLLLAGVSLFCGKYPLTFAGVMSGEGIQRQVFVSLRLARTLTAIAAGFVLGTAGFVYQTVFRNPLASPDIIGISSGASAGAAAGILFFGTPLPVTFCSFAGALFSMAAVLILASVDRTGRKSTIVLAGITVHALAQAVLMCLKFTADPEKELAAIEFWIMGSLSSVQITDLPVPLFIAFLAMIFLYLLHRQTVLLSMREDEARMLGAEVNKLRMLILALATLSVAAVVSLTGLISFAGLLGPHCARLLTGKNNARTMFLGGLIGSCILLAADILARTVGKTELPISIFTSLIGAPFLLALVVRGRRGEDG